MLILLRVVLSFFPRRGIIAAEGGVKMNDRDIELLRRICSGEITSISGLPDEDVSRIEAFENRGFLQSWISGEFDVLPAAHDALASENEMKQRKCSETSDRRADRRHDWMVAVIGAIAAGGALLILEYLLG